MSDSGRPRGGGGAADEMLGALSQRVRELQSKLATLQSELDEAQRKLATYEEFDSTLQDALSGALRAAYEIRSRAEDTAQQILEQAREERRMLLKETQRLRDERDSLQDEIATLRRGGLTAVPRPAPAVEAPSGADLKTAATDAMRSVFEEILSEMRGRMLAEMPHPAPRPEVTPQPTVTMSAAVTAPPTSVAQPMALAPQPAAPVAAPPAPAVVPQPAATQPATVEPVAPRAPAPTNEVTPQPVAPQPVMPQAVAPQREPAAVTLAPQPRPVPAPPAAASAPRPAAEPSTPTTEVQLVLSPIPSFPRLVEIERRIQSLSGVRTLYVRDFRNGVATLAVGLRTAMTADEFASAVGTIASPRFVLESVVRNSVELRIETEAQTA